jgi:hypothetical protein
MKYEPFHPAWIPIHGTAATFDSLDCGHQSDRAALWITAGASLKEVPVRAGHILGSFTVDRYGHLLPSRTRRSVTAWTRCSCP